MSQIPLAGRARLALAALALAAFPAAGCGGGSEPDAEEAPLVETPAAPVGNTVLAAARAAGLSTFETAVRQAGLDRELAAEGPFTILAPTDAAFEALRPTLDTLLTDPHRDRLQRLLRYHVIPGRIEAASIAGTIEYASALGAPLTLDASADGVAVTDAEGNRARVVTNDINADNGVLHTVDRVLMPGSWTPADSAAAAAR